LKEGKKEKHGFGKYKKLGVVGYFGAVLTDKKTAF